MKTTNVLNKSWSSYDKTVAQSQLNNYDIIFLDEYDCPIDDEFLLEDLFLKWKGDK